MAQTEKSPNEGLCAVPGLTPGVTQVCWWGRTGRTYFLQTNPTLAPSTWTYMPVVETGSNAVLSYSLGGNAPRMFARLAYTDQPFSADLDGDGLTNAQEVAIGGPGTDPLLADSDWDGYDDGAELLAGTSPTNGQTNPGTTPPASGDLNPDTRYRHGLRLDIAAKYMQASDYTSTFTTPTSYNCSASARHTAGSTQSIYPFQSSTTGTLLEDCQEDFDKASFLSPSKSLFELNGMTNLRGTRSDYLITGTEEGKGSQSYYRERWEMQVQAQASPAAAPWARRSLAMLLLKDYSATDVEAAGWVMLSKHNVRASPSAVKHCKIAGSKVVIAPWLDPDQPDLDSNSNNDYRYINRWIKLLDAEIEPADGMIGVVGDMVRSKSDVSHVRHFVTPKLTTEIPAPHVELKCGVSVADFDTYFEWEGGTAGSAANLRKVSRSTAARTMVKIKNKQTGTVVAEMHVWVVWCDPPTVTTSGGVFGFWSTPNLGIVGKEWVCSGTWKFKYAIKPDAICDPATEERPDLSGNRKNPPPGAAVPYMGKSEEFADTAENKWDLSRKLKITVRNPSLIARGDLRSTFNGTLFDRQPVAHDVIPFPTNPVEGNDDPYITDEDTNPEVARTGDLAHGIGELSSIDSPRFPVANSWGGTGTSYDLEANFREFCRLEITDGTRTTGTHWFRISDYTDWHHYLNTIKSGPVWEDTYSSAGLDHPFP